MGFEEADGTSGDMLEQEREWEAMQARRVADGDEAALEGGWHEIDYEEAFTVGALQHEVLGHSCSLASTGEVAETEEATMGSTRGDEVQKHDWFEKAMECYTVKESSVLGTGNIHDSHLVKKWLHYPRQR